jgi:hypothetical protein
MSGNQTEASKVGPGGGRPTGRAGGEQDRGVSVTDGEDGGCTGLRHECYLSCRNRRTHNATVYEDYGNPVTPQPPR